MKTKMIQLMRNLVVLLFLSYNLYAQIVKIGLPAKAKITATTSAASVDSTASFFLCLSVSPSVSDIKIGKIPMTSIATKSGTKERTNFVHKEVTANIQVLKILFLTLIQKHNKIKNNFTFISN